MSMTAFIGAIFALALWVLAAPSKPLPKRRLRDGSRDGISINIYQQGPGIPPNVVVHDAADSE